MAEPPREPSLSIEQRRALALLASIPHGIIEDSLVVAFSSTAPRSQASR